jgi:DNA-directed RNA polymerase subunit RPC12/RpoP
MSLIFTCEHCGHTVEGWDEGNPYIIDSKMKRVYFYHPGGEHILEQVAGEVIAASNGALDFDTVLKERTGNAPDHVCMQCGHIRKFDPGRDTAICRKCGGTELVKAYHIGGKPCPKCKVGKFSEGELGAIS